MSGRRALAGAMLVLLTCTVGAAVSTSNGEQNRELLRRLKAAHDLSPDQMRRVEAIFAGTFAMGQGNPAIARHPMTPAQCRENLERKRIYYENPEFERICRGKYMAPLYDPETIEAMDRILVACQRPTLAESALYSYSRGGTEITGPSIRLAEALAQNWQNIQFGIRELDQRNGESTVESYAWDFETNCRQSKVFQVKHIRAT